MMKALNQALIDDAFLHLSNALPPTLADYGKGYLQALKDFKRHLENTLKEIN